LLEADIRTSPESARIQYAYGSTLLLDLAAKENNPQKKIQLQKKAVDHLEKSVSILNNNGDAWLNLGIAYKGFNDTARALKCFELAGKYKVVPDPDFYSRLGDYYHDLRNDSVADKYYDK